MVWVDAIFIDVFDEVLLLDDCVVFVYELPFLQDTQDLLDKSIVQASLFISILTSGDLYATVFRVEVFEDLLTNFTFAFLAVVGLFKLAIVGGENLCDESELFWGEE